MERATNAPAARLPAAWHAWWSLPVAICLATAVVLVVGAPQDRPTVLLVGAPATAATAICVERLLNCERRARQAAGNHHAQAAADKVQAEHWLASVQQKHAAEVSALHSQLSQLTEFHKAQLVRIAEEFLPKAVDELRAGEAMDDLLRPLADDPDVPQEFKPTLRKLLRSAMLAIEEEFDRSSSARNSVVSIGSRMQVYTNKIRADLHEMQGVHCRLPTVARDLMQLDQELGPADCLAASIVVLGGADHPGRQWQTHQPLISVVRGGMGRIKEYKRIQLRRLPQLGVDGSLVDHLTLIFAHLMDNATRYSPPAEPVIVSAKEVPNGLGIQIQDAGTGLRAEKRQQAMRLLNGVAIGSGPGGLAEDAQIGLRVVGNLARKYGITVTFDDSPWLGTAAVVVVPHKYFKPLDKPMYSDPPRAARLQRRPHPAVPARPEPAAARPEPVPAGSDAAPGGPTATAGQDRPDTLDEDPVPDGTTPGGLPKRSKPAMGVPGPGNGVHAAPGVDTSSVPPEESFAGLAAFVSSNSPADVSGNSSPVNGPATHDRLDEQQESD
ncbi:ATP-binding protein [Streptomyces oryzae]|uniref:histidine kinase n=1 Tax=Streptomyces oryzae TaxID=1434886 RepID=A0ABS3X4K9_9ACTN|nr:ATP-binding protein [Streptomyces oryzae]MBO8190278.1 ATP-binding protein [Streptomyces oryzae]